MASLASNLTQGGSLVISVAQVGIGLVAGYTIGRIARDATLSALDFATETTDSIRDAVSDATDLDLDLDIDIPSIDIGALV